MEEHSLAKKGFPLNEILVSLLLEQPNEVYRSKESEQLKLNLTKIETLLNELSFDMGHGVDKIKEHCIELRIQVQLAVEHKIQEINEFNDAFIKQIDAAENDKLVYLLRLADLVKFAKAVPHMSEHELSFTNAVHFVEATTPAAEKVMSNQKGGEA
jgi:hypothetical protein